VPLPQPSTAAGAAGLAALLADPARAVIASDFDGTLAAIVENPTEARAHPGAVPVLARLAPYVDSVALITGRPATVAVAYAGLAGVPELGDLVVLGHYGLERWEARKGEVVAPEVGVGVAAARAALPDLLASLGVPEGTWIEDKGSSVAVHTRRTADPDGVLETLREPVYELAARHHLAVEPGRMVLELRPPGMDKGKALTEYVQERKAGTVVFAGDDLGDLAAFAAVDTLREAGMAGLKVCSGSAEVSELARQADLVVNGPAGVVELFEAVADALDERKTTGA
jgi:trehalose 6-phosphate phosphatase